MGEVVLTGGYLGDRAEKSSFDLRETLFECAGTADGKIASGVIVVRLSALSAVILGLDPGIRCIGPAGEEVGVR
tara:strand:- start:1151 stop:1372 length:222 start_codon:yes stop_codon:yes gene_type:complete